MEHKKEYYAGLSGVTQRGSWKFWILYMLKAVEVTANITYQKINDIIMAKDAILEAVIEDNNFIRPESFVNFLFT